MTSRQRFQQAEPRRRVRWGRLFQAAFFAYVVTYVFGYLYWHFFAVLWGPGPAWAIELLVWVGLPAAFLAGRFRQHACRGCEERDRTIRLLEDRAAELLRERDHALAETGHANSTRTSQQ